MESCRTDRLPEFKNRHEGFICRLEDSKEEKQAALKRLEAKECTSCRELINDHKSSTSPKPP